MALVGLPRCVEVDNLQLFDLKNRVKLLYWTDSRKACPWTWTGFRPIGRENLDV
jgi:hypothetical protein